MKTKLLGMVAALALLSGANSAAQATTYNYSLNGTLAEDSGTGPSLVAYGGTLAPGGGYIFGMQQGLSLSGTGTYDVYSIDIRFYFDNVNSSSNSFQKILDSKEFNSGHGTL